MRPPDHAAPPTRLPRALRRGDRVAVVSPSGPLQDGRRPDLERGMLRLRAWGLEPYLGKHALDRFGFLAGADEDRANDLQSAFADRSCRAIFCLRGGYGATRILEHLDYSPLAEDPKPILGYSDATALLAAVWREVGLVSFHGPMVATSRALAFGRSFRDLQRQLISNRSETSTMPHAERPTPHVIRPGRAEGRLVGGNLTLVCSLIGTSWELDTTGRILFLEDTGERPYRIDRKLTQLRDAGHLARAAAIVFGDFHLDDGPLGDDVPDVVRVLRERTEDLRCPVAHGFPFGHRPDAWTIPFGTPAMLDARDVKAMPTLRLLEPSVT